MPPNPPTPLTLKITLKGYVTPSLNRTNRQHWSVYQKEKKKARIALMLALSDLASDSSTQTTSLEVANRYSIALDRAISYSMTHRNG